VVLTLRLQAAVCAPGHAAGGPGVAATRKGGGAVIDTRHPLPPTTNPAEAAYYAYWRAWPAPLALPWEVLTHDERRAWRNVARMMRDWWTEEEETS
jgi:hypothetical protein